MALVSWNKLCLLKSKGRIGFSNLSAFNDALIAKQCWRLVTNPDSFAAKVLKGKSFHRTTFWKAKLPNYSCYTWRSIMGARELLSLGLSWVMGNGRSVKFWEDKWSPNLLGETLFGPTC
ncbi:uncharacterized mitochondrial protein AtMg00310-like [Beta vulgaris subsp. vulgaris]|uniref:uncharacterized mitochondrial protein AtMg00310-like n=1 Tax=Beta vulgaris subsp. vulgaris TaxID=3555 RepID=UPI000901E783|nr:uncharacterized mitochondrial protein AtMg00310-like [Beta vulgaris subsp. vulgaris]